MAVVGLVFLALVLLIFASVSLFVYQMESEIWRGRQMDAARYAAQTVSAFVRRNEEALKWADLLALDDRFVSGQSVFELLLRENPAFLEIAHFDQRGNVLAAAAHGAAVLGNLFTIPQSEWFQAARGGRAYYTSVQVSAQNEPYLIYARPTHDGGVLAARVKMDLLWEVVSNVHFGQTGNAFVITPLGQVIAHPNSAVVLANLSLSNQPELPAIVHSAGYEWFGTRTDFKGRAVLSVSTAIVGTDWIVITDLPQSEAHAASRMLLTVLPLGVFGVAFGIMIILRRTLFGMLRSVGMLRTAALQIAQGDLSYRIEAPRTDELGEVMLVFNDMVTRLQEQRTALERRATENAQLYEQAQHELIERQRMEEALRALNEQLEERVEARTLDLMRLNTDLARENAERRRIEAELATQRDFALQIMNTMGQGLTVTNAERQFEFVNPAYAQMVGYRPDQLIGKSPKDLTDSADLSALEQAHTRRLEGATTTYETRLRRTDGSLVNVLVTGSPRLHQGQWIGSIAVVTDLTVQKHVEEQIRASLHEKEMLLKEVHHRVKNNLQVISSLLALQAKQVRDNPEAEAALRESQQRVRSMALIHEKLYQSQNLAQINLADYVRHLATSMVRFYQGGVRVDLRLDLEAVALGVDQAVPCGLILNELITNALKYAWPGGGRGCLWVDLHAGPGARVELRVADDGPGLPAGLDIDRTSSLGLQLVVSLAAQLQGTVSVGRARGAEFRVVFFYPGPE
jgi:PAS domain S-box-containing protein